MDTWTHNFDECLKRYFAIDHIDAGMSEQDLARYRDLTPQDAALTFGQDYDLNRVDGPWGC
jgi:hypothetical protein